MTANPIKVSVILATKDRYETLFDCIHGLLVNYANPEVEIIVRDNSSKPRADEFRAIFSSHANVVYIPDATPVSQSANYELALAAARGDFVTMIGDDDGIAWGTIELAAWMERNSIDAVFAGFSVYLWPGVNPRLSVSNRTGILSLDSRFEPARLVDATREREEVLRTGGASLKELPRLYYGLVRRLCLDRVRDAAGLCFPGPSPDMANAYALSYFVNRFVVTSLPIFISGNSRQSAAGLGLRGRHVSEIRNLPFLPKDTAELWNRDIPFFWSGQTIWCQSIHTAASALGHAGELADKDHFIQLYARLLVFHPAFFRRTLAAFRHRHQASGLLRTFAVAAAVLGLTAQLWVSRVAGFARRRLHTRKQARGGHTVVQNLPNVSSATREVDKVMHQMNFEQWLERSLLSTPVGKSFRG